MLSQADASNAMIADGESPLQPMDIALEAPARMEVCARDVTFEHPAFAFRCMGARRGTDWRPDSAAQPRRARAARAARSITERRSANAPVLSWSARAGADCGDPPGKGGAGSYSRPS